jgi:hypothetical protein
MITKTESAKIVKIIVLPAPIPKAAPGFFTKVSWRKEPITSTLALEDKTSTAQTFVPRSNNHTTQAMR